MKWKKALLNCIGMPILSGVPAVQAGSMAQGAAVAGHEGFMTYCAGCHGVSDKGDGVIAELLKVTPKNLTQMSVKNDGKFPHQRAIEVIDGRAQAAQ